MEVSYYGRLSSIEKIPAHKRISKMLVDEQIKKILEKACDDLIKQNQAKWLHFERRMKTEINLIRKDIRYLMRKMNIKELPIEPETEEIEDIFKDDENA